MGGFKGKGRLHRWTLTLRSEWVKPQTLLVWVLCMGDKLPWLVGWRIPGTHRKTGEAWTPTHEECRCWLALARAEGGLP